jgi:hypothetical protein
MSEKTYQIVLSHEALQFVREIAASKLAVTMENVEVAAEFKRAVAQARELPALRSVGVSEHTDD